MKKVINFFKQIPELYYNLRTRNEKIDSLIANHSETIDKMSMITESLAQLEQRMTNIEAKVDSISSHLDAVKHGTKMELFETLHNWYILLVVKRGWASPEEKKEVEEIFLIYNKKLHGNGNGERYYQKIIALPESEEEKEAMENV